jgi:hypothetical protein
MNEDNKITEFYNYVNEAMHEYLVSKALVDPAYARRVAIAASSAAVNRLVAFIHTDIG